MNNMYQEATVHLNDAQQGAHVAEQRADMLQQQILAMQHAQLAEINAAGQRQKQLEANLRERELAAYRHGLAEGRDVSTTANGSVGQASREGLLADEHEAPRKGLPCDEVFQIGAPISTPSAHTGKDNPYAGTGKCVLADHDFAGSDTNSADQAHDRHALQRSGVVCSAG